MEPITTDRDAPMEPAVGRLRGHWLDESLDLLYIVCAALGVGCAVGMAYGWPAGLAALAGVAIAVYGLLHLVRSLARRSLQTQVSQRQFPRARR